MHLFRAPPVPRALSKLRRLHIAKVIFDRCFVFCGDEYSNNSVLLCFLLLCGQELTEGCTWYLQNDPL